MKREENELLEFVYLYGRREDYINLLVAKVEKAPFHAVPADGEEFKDHVLRKLHESRKLLLRCRGIYSMYFGSTTFLMDLETGDAYRFNNTKYECQVEGNQIYLRTWLTTQRKLVYDDGKFFTSKRKGLMESYSRSGSGKYKAVSVYDNEMGYTGVSVIIRVHQLIILLLEGEKALKAIGTFRKYDINHIDSRKDNNLPHNLEIVTQSQNRQHAIEAKRRKNVS